MQSSKEAFLTLARLGVGSIQSESIPENVEWEAIEAIALQHGLSALIIDGIEKLPDNQRPPKELLLQWIGGVMQDETRYSVQQKTASEIALLFHENHIRTYVLKGAVVAECYPEPQHRVSTDLDCFLMPENSDLDAWGLGNDLIKSRGFEVSTGYYKDCSFYLPGLTVENHKYLTPFRGNKKLKNLERVLQSMLLQDKGKDRFNGTWLCRPPVLVSALFLIEHAYSHFLHEGLTWRHVLDWMMFSGEHKDEITWSDFEILVEEFGFKKFYESYVKLGHYLLGDITEDGLSRVEKKMLVDIWSPLDLHETVRGVKGKLALVGNTWRARWKYRYFSEISMPHALWIQVKGFLFDKHPTLH